MYTIFWSKSSVGWIICHKQLFANSHVILDISPFSTERIDKWLGFLCEPCFIYYHCSLQLRLWMHYIYNKHSLSLQQHFLLVSGVLLMENGKNCFTMPVCDRWLYLLCRSERTDWGMERWNQSFLPNIRLKPAEQENLTQYLIFDHFGK